MARPKLSPKQKRNRWRMGNEIRQLIIDKNVNIIKDPNSTARQIGIASKLLVSINRQNMDLEPEETLDNTVQIALIED